MLRLFRQIWDTDDLLERAWHERRWNIFTPLWFKSSVAMAVLCFVLPFFAIPVVLVIDGVALIFGSKGIIWSIPDLWNFAWPFSALVGLLCLIFTVPVMVLKEYSGEFKRYDTPTNITEKQP
jgi:hypothetical protein